MIGILTDEGVSLAGMPEEHEIERAVRTALSVASADDTADLCVRLASDAAVRELNARWRGKDRVTDVLSFPMQEPPVHPEEPLGDIVLAVDFVRAEAERLGLPPRDHALHLVVHGTLHLLGCDHMEAEDARRMQAFENAAMAALGLHQPWPDTP
ncbi:MAG: rRNA maturation RNase YbeY [Mariprofundaceae bacterium]